MKTTFDSTRMIAFAKQVVIPRFAAFASGGDTITDQAVMERFRSILSTSDDRNDCILLDKLIAHIGHRVGERDSTTFVAAGSWAMPITHKVPVLGITLLDVLVFANPGETGKSQSAKTS